MKYTKDILTPIVKSSLSVAEVIRKLGLKHVNGGTHAHISKRIKQFEIDTSHFLGQSRNKGIAPRNKIHWSVVLVNNRLNLNKEHTQILKRSMIESGIEYVCDTCNVKPIWNNKQLVLQISHKDGDCLNNVRTNLHFECPNCHSQTEDFSGRSAGKKSLMRC